MNSRTMKARERLGGSDESDLRTVRYTCDLIEEQVRERHILFGVPNKESMGAITDVLNELRDAANDRLEKHDYPIYAIGDDWA